MTDDRELLEAAARSAGLVIHDASSTGLWAYPIGSQLNWDGEYPIFDWNPLTDDGDALRLAVKLNLAIFPDDYPKADKPYALAEASDPDQRPTCASAFHDGDRYAAVRRAIVGCAASLADAATKEPNHGNV